MRSLCCSSVFCADDGGGLEIFSAFGVQNLHDCNGFTRRRAGQYRCRKSSDEKAESFITA